MREPAFAARLIFNLQFLLLISAPLTFAQKIEVVTFADAKSQLAVSALKNSRWPGEESIDEFVIALYGDAPQMLAALERDTASIRIRGKAVSVSVVDSLDAAAASHVLLLPQESNGLLASIRRRLLGTDTLIVSDAAEDSANIMMNFTYPSKDRVAFEISASNMIAAGLTPSRELLLFAGDKRDLADVYLETEQRLAQARALAEEQQRRLATQSATIERQLEEMAANRRELDAFESQLTGVQRLLKDSVAQIGANARELKEKAQVLAAREASIASYTQSIEENQQRLEVQQKRLEAQQRSIREQERQIAEQDTVLVTQLSTIESQRLFLVAIASVLCLVLLLIALTFRAYRSKHRIAVELEAKTGELEVANKKLLEVTEAKSLFLSTMSHEIRTPMNGVIGMAELLEGTSLTDQQDEYVSLILKSADTLLGLINDILDFSKIEAGHLDLEMICFNLRDVLGDTLQTLALRANEKGLELTFHIPPDVPQRLIGDPLRLRQVTVNLVGNAIKFTESGEVAVDLSLQSLGEQAQILFEVRDTGIGISPAQQQKIFEAFSQADSSTTRQFGGTGLGLSIAGQLVQLMGGELAVRSEPGEGSTFYFTAGFGLPVGPEPHLLQPEELRGHRVLVVDDNETNRMILEELLATWGMEAHCVVGGLEALQLLDARDDDAAAFSVALLDVMMPHMDGFALAAEIRRRELTDMRLLMLTSAGRSESDDLCQRLDISRVLLKPTKHSDLQQAISDALGVSQATALRELPQGLGDTEARRVLLAEDNPVNRRVASEVLRRRGHLIEVAANGREAVEASARQVFDLIFMDVHMPLMDGLTATRIIRERERDGGASHVPIIALTAGATLEDRENCLSAGMDGFVSKPFRARELIRTVEEVATGGLESAVDMNVTAVIAAQTPEPGGDEPCLDWHAALRNLEGDEEFLRELSEMFLTQYPGMITTIGEAVAAGASDELGRASHALKGSSLVIGGRAVAATALRLEKLGRAGRADQAAPLLHSLKQQLVELRDALNEELAIS